jgi:hypothetical protein
MSKLIAVFIVIVALFVGWQFFVYWEKVRDEKEAKQKQQASSVVAGEQLSGLPYNLAQSFETAKKQGAAGLKNWLKNYGRMVQDPRKAWIELDYCVLVSHDDLPEARRVFAEVKARTPESSPVWPRIKELQKVYE